DHVTAVAVADINGDGKPDIITGNDPGDGRSFGERAGISILLSNGPGSFATFHTYHAFTMFSGPSSLAMADFNGDGKLDIAALNGYDGEVDVAFNNSLWDQEASYQIGVNAGGSPATVAAGDFNSDGKPDLVAADGTSVLNVLLNTGNGSFAIQNV